MSPYVGIECRFYCRAFYKAQPHFSDDGVTLQAAAVFHLFQYKNQGANKPPQGTFVISDIGVHKSKGLTTTFKI